MERKSAVPCLHLTIVFEYRGDANNKINRDSLCHTMLASSFRHSLDYTPVRVLLFFGFAIAVFFSMPQHSAAASDPFSQKAVIDVIRQKLGTSVLPSEEEKDGDKQSDQQSTNDDGDPLPQETKPQDVAKLTAEQTLGAYYGSSEAQLLWIGDKGLNAEASALLDEFRIADRYGLRPRDFSFEEPGDSETGFSTPEKTAELELTLSRLALKYMRYAAGGRIDPRKLSRFQDRGPRRPDYMRRLEQLARTSDSKGVLRDCHPKHPQFEKLRQRLLALTFEATASGSLSEKPAGNFPATGPILRPGSNHVQVRQLRKRLGIPVSKTKEDLRFGQDVQKAVMAFQRKQGLGADGIVGPTTRRRLAGIKTLKESREKLRARLLINMERWRWMPDRLEGDNDLYVWANVPELRVRIIKSGKTIFSEKAITGQLGKQTPMFSDEMEWIEFNPTWYIPNSIKVADVLPSLRRKGRVMERYHLRVDCGAYGRDWRAIDWKKVDIRRCSVTQPAGRKSVLGDFKFKFPNKHSVYMHDTLTPGLFSRTHRILSHGCVRVQNPRRMAEILLNHDKGYKAQKISALLGRGLHKEYLTRKVPVHMTYFSTLVDEQGHISHHRDYYGHDKRLAQALLGKGHLFKGAIYGGGGSYRPRRPRPPRHREPRLPRFMMDN